MPDVELISAATWCCDGLVNDNPVSFIKRIQTNAIAYGEQKQQAKDAEICRNMAKENIETGFELVARLYALAARAIEDSK